MNPPRHEHSNAKAGRSHHRSRAYDRPLTGRNVTNLETLAELLGPTLDVPPLCPTCEEPFGDGACDDCREERIRRNQPDAKTKAVLARGNRDE